MREKIAQNDEPRWRRDAHERIARQFALIEQLVPNSEAHKLATGVLLTLQDSLHVLTDARAVIARIEGTGRTNS